MDMWKYFGITHREHVICNPTNEEKLDRLVALLRLAPGAQVVDIACGKAEFLIRTAERYGARCLGIDLSPFFIEEAGRSIRARAPGAEVLLREMNGADFEPDEPHGFAMASCLGGSWIYGGHGGTLDALIRLVAPGGWVITGEPYWRQEPPPEYVEACGFGSEAFGTHAGNVEAGETRGLELVHTLVSSQDDWDRYEGLQWYAASEYARSHPEDPDVPELLEKVAKERTAYLRWGRETLGWAIYLFRRPLVQRPAHAGQGAPKP